MESRISSSAKCEDSLLNPAATAGAHKAASIFSVLTSILYGEIIVLFYLLVCVFSDVGGYAVGKSIGGKKLTKISPKKTISGSFGSFLFSLFPIGIYSALSSLTNNNLFHSNFGNQDNEVIFVCLILS